MRKATTVLILLIDIAAALLLGCYRLDENESSHLDPKATEIWHKHELVFAKALRGSQKDDDFERACLFFEQVTGLKIHANFFTLGVLPTPETERDFVKIKAWYQENKHRLYWDESTSTVKVRPVSK